MAVRNYQDGVDKVLKLNKYKDTTDAFIENELKRASSNQNYYARLKSDLVNPVPPADERTSEEKIADTMYLEKLALDNLKKLTSSGDAAAILSYLRDSNQVPEYVRYAVPFGEKFKGVSLLDLITFQKLWESYDPLSDSVAARKEEFDLSGVKILDLLKSRFPFLKEKDKVKFLAPRGTTKSGLIRVLEKLSQIPASSFIVRMLIDSSSDLEDLFNIMSFLAVNDYAKNGIGEYKNLDSVMPTLKNIYMSISPDYYKRKILPLLRDDRKLISALKGAIKSLPSNILTSLNKEKKDRVRKPDLDDIMNPSPVSTTIPIDERFDIRLGRRTKPLIPAPSGDDDEFQDFPPDDGPSDGDIEPLPRDERFDMQLGKRTKPLPRDERFDMQLGRRTKPLIPAPSGDDDEFQDFPLDEGPSDRDIEPLPRERRFLLENEPPTLYEPKSEEEKDYPPPSREEQEGAPEKKLSLFLEKLRNFVPAPDLRSLKNKIRTSGIEEAALFFADLLRALKRDSVNQIKRGLDKASKESIDYIIKGPIDTVGEAAAQFLLRVLEPRGVTPSGDNEPSQLAAPERSPPARSGFDSSNIDSSRIDFSDALSKASEISELPEPPESGSFWNPRTMVEDNKEKLEKLGGIEEQVGEIKTPDDLQKAALSKLTNMFLFLRFILTGKTPYDGLPVTERIGSRDYFISRGLGNSLTIYDRSGGSSSTSLKGKQKKEVLLAYIRQNLAEAKKIQQARYEAKPRGRGYVAPKRPSKYFEFGDLRINARDLSRGRLLIKNKECKQIKHWKSMPITSALSKVILDIIMNKEYEVEDYDALSAEEKKLLDKMIFTAKIKTEGGMYKKGTVTDIERDGLLSEFNLLKGMVIAGNDNPDVIKNLRAVTVKLREKNYIKPSDYSKIMELISLIV